VQLIQEIGSYAGLAAIPGLAVLSALYFSQARDVRRLRDWAGRAPERAAEHAQGGRVVARPAAQPVAQPAAQPAVQPAAQPAAAPAEVKPAAAAASAAPAVPAAAASAAASGGGGGGTATATPPRTAPATAAGAGAGANATGPRRITPRTPGAGHTAILGRGAPPEPDPWYRRLADRLPPLRYLAILLVGIAVVGGGIAYGITQLGNDRSGSGAQQTSKTAGNRTGQSRTVVPGDVSVSVLNGTTVSGLAHNFGTKLDQAGFKVINLVTAQSQANESVVLFKPGANREARTVADALKINNIQPADADSINQAGDAEVIVVVGADQAPAQETVPTSTTPSTTPTP
jgi:hypothetical protein